MADNQLPEKKPPLPGPRIPIGSRRPGDASDPALSHAGVRSNPAPIPPLAPPRKVDVTVSPAAAPAPEIVLPVAFGNANETPTVAHVRFDSGITWEKLRQLRLVLEALDKAYLRTDGGKDKKSSPASGARVGQTVTLRVTGGEPAPEVSIPVSYDNSGIAVLAHVRFEGLLRKEAIGALGRALAAMEKVHRDSATERASRKVSVTLEVPSE